MNQGTIRRPKPTDIEEIIRIWLEGNIQAHPFIQPDYWLKHMGWTTIIVDEVDDSLHPSLLKAIMSKIMSSKPADGGQFIVSTHESNLLDYDIYRQDEIWFVEKNNGSTVLYPLTDFKPRADLQIQKGYLMGRFGAVPFLANLKTLNWL